MEKPKIAEGQSEFELDSLTSHCEQMEWLALEGDALFNHIVLNNGLLIDLGKTSQGATIMDAFHTRLNGHHKSVDIIIESDPKKSDSLWALITPRSIV